MLPYFDVHPISNPSIVGFAEAELLTPEMAVDLVNRVEHVSHGSLVPDDVLRDIGPLVLAAVEAANSLHFRFELTEIWGDDEPILIRPDETISLAGLQTDHPNRKLSLALTLSGSAPISFPSIGKDRRLISGRIALFPSFLANEIRADQGEGLVAVVMYASGPSFT